MSEPTIAQAKANLIDAISEYTNFALPLDSFPEEFAAYELAVKYATLQSMIEELSEHRSD